MTVTKKIKQKLYFQVGAWFGRRAKVKLGEWKPTVIVVTGSSGKTTLFSLLETQLGTAAKYSHDANSVFGVPFNILGLKRRNFRLGEWVGLFWGAMKARRKAVPKEKIYVVECDCDRPGEGKFLAELLEPDYVLWLNTGDTHAMNYETVVRAGEFDGIEEAQAFEYGWFLEKAKKGVIVNGEQKLIKEQKDRVGEGVEWMVLQEKEWLRDYKVGPKETEFKLRGGEKVKVPALLPRSAWMGVVMTLEMGKTLELSKDDEFRRFKEPPSRATIWEGARGITLIDSTYNSSPVAMQEMLQLLVDYRGGDGEKWAVLSDMTELGEKEGEEHEKLVEMINKARGLKRVWLLGRRMKKYVEPKLGELQVPAKVFEDGNKLFDELAAELKGGEVILFKGSRFLEDMVEALLANKEDVKKLTRREKVWQKRRAKFFDLERARERIQKEKSRSSEVGREVAKEKERNQQTRRDREEMMSKEEKIIIVPGWSYDNQRWEPIVAKLEEWGYKVKMLEVPGLTGGELEKVWTVDDYSEWLEEQLRREKEVIVIAHSNGGRMVLSWAAAGGDEKLRKLILIDSAGLIDQRRKVKLKRWLGKSLAKIGKGLGMDKEGARRVLYRLLRENDYLEAGRGGKKLRQTMSNLVETDLEEKLRLVGVETLLIWGSEDGQTPLYQGEIMQKKMPRAKLRVITGARHVPQFTHRDEVMKELAQFLRE